MAVSQTSLGFPAGTILFQDTAQAATAIAVATSSKTIYTLQLDNSMNAAQDVYVKLWNTAGAVVVGTTVPDMVLMVRQGTVKNHVCPDGIPFVTGIAVATVITGGTAGTTPPTVPITVKIVYS